MESVSQSVSYVVRRLGL